MKFTEAKRKINLAKNGLLQKMPNSKNWLVKNEFFWIVDYENMQNSEIIIVPKNFVTDFWSIPQFLWWFYNPTRYVAYILHDFLYSKRYTSPLAPLLNQRGERKSADLILKEALKVEWMGILKRNLVYLAIRVFGWKFYKK